MPLAIPLTIPVAIPIAIPVGTIAGSVSGFSIGNVDGIALAIPVVDRAGTIQENIVLRVLYPLFCLMI